MSIAADNLGQSFIGMTTDRTYPTSKVHHVGN
jgi:hypothetical protein